MNPITALRARLGMSLTELAQALGTPYQKVWEAERGRLTRVPSVWSEPLSRLGEDVTVLQSQYRTWMASQQEAAIRRHQAGTILGQDALAAGEAIAEEALAYALEHPGEVRDVIEELCVMMQEDRIDDALAYARRLPWIMRFSIAVVWAHGSVAALREAVASRTPRHGGQHRAPEGHRVRRAGDLPGAKTRSERMLRRKPLIQQDGGDHDA